MKEFVSIFLTFLMLVNPIQKLFVIMPLHETYSAKEMKIIVNRSNITALCVLLFFLLLGEAFLRYTFRIQIYTFQITCGIVLFYNGFSGLQKGTFLQTNNSARMEDIIAVPLAIPMIAGPATITAVVSMPAIYGKAEIIAAVILAISINWLIMRKANTITKILLKYNILMPLIRIMGLMVAAIGTQMVLNGLFDYIDQLK
ncbi:MAG: MarC family protein [Prevotellaceae bacterium]|jgi:multiple antibiotic resistance protein|nr:MarC family protein [Prevotellaceae bacterium]